jgi:L-lactate dehydrogenase (cytochrome)
MMSFLGANGMFANFETVRRGTDILKAICLGATAVGLGRSFMYSLSAYGTDGVLKAIQLLSDEIETTMRFLGVNR